MSRLEILIHKSNAMFTVITTIATATEAFEGEVESAVHWEQVTISSKFEWVQDFDFAKFLAFRTYSRITADPVLGVTAELSIDPLVNCLKQLNCLRDILLLDFGSNMRGIKVYLYYTAHISYQSQMQ